MLPVVISDSYHVKSIKETFADKKIVFFYDFFIVLKELSIFFMIFYCVKKIIFVNIGQRVRSKV